MWVERIKTIKRELIKYLKNKHTKYNGQKHKQTIPKRSVNLIHSTLVNINNRLYLIQRYHFTE